MYICLPCETLVITDCLQHKWVSLLHHVQDDHDGSWGRCDHDIPLAEQPTDRHGDILPWFSSDETAMEVLRKVVMDKRWLESLKYYVHFRLVNTAILVLCLW